MDLLISILQNVLNLEQRRLLIISNQSFLKAWLKKNDLDLGMDILQLEIPSLDKAVSIRFNELVQRFVVENNNPLSYR